MHNFKGKVIIQDVKDELDNLVDTINNIIDTYNSIPTVESIDYTVGGTRLAPSGYTLTVGGLKQALNAVNGMIIGSKLCRIDDENIKITDGVLLTKDKVIRLPERNIPYDHQSPAVYYNNQTGEYQLNDEGSEVYKISDLNMNRPSRLVSDRFSIQCENFDGKYKITVKSRTFGDPRWGATMPPDTNKPYFFAGIEAHQTQRTGTAYSYLFNDNIAYNRQTGGQNLDYWTPIPLLFIPKGINVNRIFRVSKSNASKTFEVDIDKRVD